MGAYLLRRLALVVPTLLGIILINFAVVQFAPGGPVEQMLAEIKGNAGSTLGRLSGESQGETRAAATQRDRRQRRGQAAAATAAPAASTPPWWRRSRRPSASTSPGRTGCGTMLAGYARFDLGRSLFRDKPVVELIVEKMPVSISLGLWSTLIIYLVSIPSGIRKAVRDGSRFDLWTTAVVLVGYAIPGFLFAILLVVLFAGGSFLQWFPLRGLLSPGMDAAPFAGTRARLRLAHGAADHRAGHRRLRRADHADQELLPRGDQQAVHRDRPRQGRRRARVLYGHVFRNAMLLIIAGFPGRLHRHIVHRGAAGGDHLLARRARAARLRSAIRRDYPVMFGTLYIFTLLGLVMQIVGDFAYTLVDPRIDFESRR